MFMHYKIVTLGGLNHVKKKKGKKKVKTGQNVEKKSLYYFLNLKYTQ